MPLGELRTSLRNPLCVAIHMRHPLKVAASLKGDQGGGGIALYRKAVLDFEFAEDPVGYQELAILKHSNPTLM